MPNFYFYEIFTEQLTHPDYGRYNCYGIVCRPAVENELVYVRDISSKLDYVADLAVKLNASQLDPIHLLDVVEDFLV